MSCFSWNSSRYLLCLLVCALIWDGSGNNVTSSSHLVSGPDGNVPEGEDFREGNLPPEGAVAAESQLLELSFDNRTIPIWDNGLNLDHIEQLMLDPLNRTKRQTLAALAGLNFGLPQQTNFNPVNNNNQNVEGLLASCQLTNLLMYQLLQQKQSPIQPAAALGINQNLIVPPMETLSTYVSTSTYVTTMTTTALVTIPLLFGNKPVPTTITRTKTYTVTTSDLVTLTSTIRPMTTQIPAAALMSVATEISPSSPTESQVVSATTEATPVEEKNVDNDEARSDVELIPASRNIESAVEKPSRRGGNKRRKSRPTQLPAKLGGVNLHANLANAKKETSRSRDSVQYKILRDNRERSRYETPTTSAPVSRGSNRGYLPANNQYSPRNSPPQVQPQQYQYQQQQQQYQQQQQQQQPLTYQQRRPVQVDPDPEYIQYPDDYSYYARRLKRGQQRAGDNDEEEYPLEREYLLEPSFQEDFSHSFEAREKCPPVPPPALTQTVTVTEIRTITKLVNPSTVTTPALPSAVAEGRTRGRGRQRARSTTTTTTTESSPADLRQQFVRRGRPRWRTESSP